MAPVRLEQPASRRARTSVAEETPPEAMTWQCTALQMSSMTWTLVPLSMPSVAVSKDSKWWAVFTTFFHALAEGANAASAGWARWARLFADFMLVVFGLFALVRQDPGWRPVGAYVLGMCVFDFVVRARGISPWISGGCALACYAAAIRWVSVDSQSLPLDARVVGTLILVSFAFSHLASTLPTAQRTPQVIAGYTILQSAISGSATAVWIATGTLEEADA